MMRRSRKARQVEFDVAVASWEPSGGELARVLCEGLARRGFRVFDCAHAPGRALDAHSQKAVDDAPDFVLIATSGVSEACANQAEPLRDTVASALAGDKNVVFLTVGDRHTGSEPSLPAIAGFETPLNVRYDPTRSDESVARVAHLLTSDVEVRDRHEMRSFKRLTLVAALVLVAVGALVGAKALSRWLAPSLDLRPLPPLALYWAAVGQHQEAGAWREFAIENDARLAGGDQIKLLFAATSDGYGYVVSRNARGEITVLFPSVRNARPDARIRGGEIYEAPADRGWAPVETLPGVGTIYVVVSYDPIENIESLIDEHAEEASAQDRQALLESAIGGLLDGRHAVSGPTVRTRRGRPIVHNLEVPVRDMTASVKLANGNAVTRRLALQPGLQSAVSEIQVHYVPAAGEVR